MTLRYEVGQEIVVLPNHGSNHLINVNMMASAKPIVLTVVKVGTKYIEASAINPRVTRQIVKATGETKEGERVWLSRAAFEEEVARAKKIKKLQRVKKIKELQVTIDKFEWSQCSMAKLEHIAEAFGADENRLAIKSVMKKIGVV